MSAYYVLLNLLNELRKRDKLRGLLSMYVRFFLSHDFKINYNHIFWHENVNVLSSLTQRYNGLHYVMLRNLCKPLVVIDFIA